MKYLFILGRNTELSQAEILCFFKSKNVDIASEVLINNGFLVEFPDKFKDRFSVDMIDELGGVISIGEILIDFDFIDDLDKINIYNETKNNFSYAIWNFSKRKEEVSEYLKQRFKSEKLKASEKRFNDSMILQNKVKVDVLRSNVQEEYFVFNNLFGKIIRHCDYGSIEKRDMEKPIRRESLSISPRLAKIMINLSEVRSGENLVDAFCGIGVILQEALLKNIKVIGIDKDKKAIQGCFENLKWFKFPRVQYMVLNFDSSKINIDNVDVMVSEPDFGETLKKIPTKIKAQEMISIYEKIISSVLLNMKKYVNKRYVFTGPYIRIGKEKRIGANFEKLTKKTGLKLVKGFPITEFRENQIVGREIVVFEK